MNVRCWSNSETDLSNPWGLGCIETDLVVGREYVVYAIEDSQGIPGYILCGEGYWRYPGHFPAELFEITDPKPSRYWIVGFQPTRTYAGGRRTVPPRIVMGFPEWVAELRFYEWMIDGRDPQLTIWQNYKELIDLEAGIGECDTPKLPSSAGT